MCGTSHLQLSHDVPESSLGFSLPSSWCLLLLVLLQQFSLNIINIPMIPLNIPVIFKKIFFSPKHPKIFFSPQSTLGSTHWGSNHHS